MLSGSIGCVYLFYVSIAFPTTQTRIMQAMQQVCRTLEHYALVSKSVLSPHLILEVNGGTVLQKCFNHRKMPLLTGCHERGHSTLHKRRAKALIGMCMYSSYMHRTYLKV